MAEPAATSDATAARLPYPKAVYFIISNEFCERFTFYGIRAILAIYLKYEIGYDVDTATVIYHAFVFLTYFTPILGAIIADSFLGKFLTILALSIVYAVGNVVLSVSAIPNFLPQIAFTLLGLALIAVGTGGIKPCVSAFGGDQFKVPEQNFDLQRFFSFFYFSINAGSLASIFITPILREDVHCFGEKSCYPLAFGLPAVLMIVAIVVFLVGKPWYVIKKPEGNIIGKALGCICRAMCIRCRQKRSYWLEKADDKYPLEFINDVKAALHVMVLFVPIPFFWALYDQQGSRWTFQATRMDGQLGEVYKIKPDQMQIFNPIFILIFVPLFDFGLYPLMAKCHLLRKPLQRMATGGFLAAISFIISAGVESALEPTYAILPQAGEGQLRLYSALPCDLTIENVEFSSTLITVPSMGKWENLHISVKDKKSFTYKVRQSDCFNEKEDDTFEVFEQESVSYIFAPENKVISNGKENIDKSANGDPRVRVIYIEPVTFEGNKIFKLVTNKNEVVGQITFNKTTVTKVLEDIPSKQLDMFIDEEKIKENVLFKQGGVYTVVIAKDAFGNYKTSEEIVTTPSTVHMAWLIPQYMVISAAEVMLSVTGLAFSFSQAPVSMKSLLQAVWLLTISFGNVIVMIVAKSKVIESQMYEFLLFAGLMVVVMLIFCGLAVWYKPKEYRQ